MTNPASFSGTSVFARSVRDVAHAASRLAGKGAFALAAATVAFFAAFANIATAAVPDDRTMDVLFVYGEETETLYGGEDGVRAQANALIARTNRAFQNSEINGAVRRAAVRKVDYTEVSFDTDLYLLIAKKGDADPQGDMDIVHDWRVEVGADTVCFIRSKPEPIGNNASIHGLGTVLMNPGGDAITAFNVSYGTAFSHELGHNLGACHDWGQVLGANEGWGRQKWQYSNLFFRDSYGYALPNGQGTIMSYNGTPILNYSNPNVLSGGFPTGRAYWDADGNMQSYPADCARSFNEIIPTVAKYLPYKPGVATPVFDPAGGTFNDEKAVTISCPDPKATIHYTTDGTDPDETSPVFYEGDTIIVQYPTVLKARAFKDDVLPSLIASASIRIDYGRELSPVTFQPKPGEYKGSVIVQLATATPDATIHYTSDGTDVTASSPEYRGPFTIQRTGVTVVKALPFKPKYNLIPQSKAEYTIIAMPTTDTPIIDIAGDKVLGGDGSTYNGPVTVTIRSINRDTGEAVKGDVIRYTTDNSEVTETSPIYTGPFVVSRTSNIKARVWRDEYKTSDMRIVAVKINPVPVSKPAILPAGGMYADSVIIRLASETSRARLRYTLDGTIPTEDSPIYDDAHPIVLDHSATVRVRGFDIDYLPSEVASAEFVVQTPESLRQAYGSRIAAGGSHSLYLTDDNELHATGWNRYGQLGAGNTTTVATPLTIAGGVSIADATTDHTLYVTRDSVLYAVGRNNYGQLGDGTTLDRSTPVQVATNVLLAAAGGYHSLFTTFDGKLHAVGRNNYGQLGTGDITDRISPVVVADYVLAASAGTFHTVFIKGDGSLWTVGRNDDGQLGVGNLTDQRLAQQILYVTEFAEGSPYQVPIGKVAAVAAGQNFSLFLTEDGKLYATGGNDYGQTGQPSNVNRVTTPVRVDTGLGKVVAIAAGDKHTLFLKADGSVWGYGLNNHGQLGQDWNALGNTAAQVVGNVAVRVTPGGIVVTAIAAGATHTMFSVADAQEGTVVYGIGSNTYGQLGDGTRTDRYQPGSVTIGTPVVAPVITPGGGVYEGTVRVTIGGSEPDASIHYTIDGSDVTPASWLYTSPITLTSGSATEITVKARAYLADKAPSDQVSAKFTLQPAPPSVPPVITREPVSQTVVLGQPVTFSVAVTATPAPTFQWQFNGRDIPGATLSSYTIEAAGFDNSGTYKVTVTNPAGVATSREAVLAFYGAPVITSQPRSTSTLEGGTVSFTVAASGDVALSYQWRRDGVLISGANGPTLTLSNVRETQSGGYDVIVSNLAGSVVSTRATLMVHAGNGTPVIVRDPAAPATVWAGNKLTLSVGVSAPDMDLVTYQWYRNGTAISGATGAVHTITKVAKSDEGVYNVRVANPAGYVMSGNTTLAVQVSAAPIVVKGLERTIGCGLGKPFELSVLAESDPEPTYQWSLNGAIIPGATGATYAIARVMPQNLGNYSVEVTSGSQKLIIGPAALVTVAPPQITSSPRGEVADGGRGVTLSVTTTGTLLSYVWKRDGVVIGTDSEIFAKDAGRYTVTVSNGAGSVTQEVATVRTSSAPQVTLSASATSVVAGDAVTFEAVAQGVGPFTYEWFCDGKKIPGVSPESPTFVTIIDASAQYSVRVENALGSASSNVVNIAVEYAPKIDRQPVSLTLPEGTSGTLNISVSGTPPFTYQWYRNDAPLPSATANILSLTNVSQSAAGVYYVVVNNGTKRPVTSVKVTVTVTPKDVTPNAQGSLAITGSVTTGVVNYATAMTNSAVNLTSLKVGTFSLADATVSTGTVLAEAPASLPVGTQIRLNGTITDSATGKQADDNVITLLAGSKLPNGDYVYTRTSATTATLAYSITYGDATYVRVETGVFELVFTSRDGGSYVLTGEYQDFSNKGEVTDGDIDGEGDFTVAE